MIEDREIENALRAGRDGQHGDAAERATHAFAERASGDGLIDVAYASTDSPLGPLMLAATPRGLVRLAYDGDDRDGVLEQLAARISPRILHAPARLDVARRELDEYFAGRRQHFDVALDWSLVRGFGERVLRTTAEIPYGGSLSYSEVAAEAGSPRGSRAAGNALGANPIAVIVPCHRVLRTGGGLGGYTGGLHRKRFLLELEGTSVS